MRTRYDSSSQLQPVLIAVVLFPYMLERFINLLGVHHSHLNWMEGGEDIILCAFTYFHDCYRDCCRALLLGFHICSTDLAIDGAIPVQRHESKEQKDLLPILGYSRIPVLEGLGGSKKNKS